MNVKAKKSSRPKSVRKSAAAKSKTARPAARKKVAPKRKAMAARRTATPATKIVRLPVAIAEALGNTPDIAIAELLQLRSAIPSTISAQHLRNNPFLAVSLDTARTVQPFQSSTLVDLRGWTGTETSLVEEALRISGRSPEDIARVGLLREAAIEIQNNFRLRKVGPDTSRRGIEGARDDTMTETALRFKQEGKALNASSLRTSTGISFRTCERFLKRRGVALGFQQQSDGKTWIPGPSHEDTRDAAIESVGVSK